MKNQKIKKIFLTMLGLCILDGFTPTLTQDVRATDQTSNENVLKLKKKIEEMRKTLVFENKENNVDKGDFIRMLGVRVCKEGDELMKDFTQILKKEHNEYVLKLDGIDFKDIKVNEMYSQFKDVFINKYKDSVLALKNAQVDGQNLTDLINNMANTFKKNTQALAAILKKANNGEEAKKWFLLELKQLQPQFTALAQNQIIMANHPLFVRLLSQRMNDRAAERLMDMCNEIFVSASRGSGVVKVAQAKDVDNTGKPQSNPQEADAGVARKWGEILYKADISGEDFDALAQAVEKAITAQQLATKSKPSTNAQKAQNAKESLEALDATMALLKNGDEKGQDVSDQDNINDILTQYKENLEKNIAYLKSSSPDQSEEEQFSEQWTKLCQTIASNSQPKSDSTAGASGGSASSGGGSASGGSTRAQNPRGRKGASGKGRRRGSQKVRRKTIRKKKKGSKK